MEAATEDWVYDYTKMTPEEFADAACDYATVKHAKRRHLIPHIARAIREAIEQERQRVALGKPIGIADGEPHDQSR